MEQMKKNKGKITEVKKEKKKNEKRWRAYKRKEALKIILRTIATAGVLAIAATSPYFLTIFVRQYFKDAQDNKKRVALARAFDYARRKQFVSWQEKDDKIYVTLLEEGKLKIKDYDFDEMVLPRKSRWDGRYHVIIFDIPDKKKAAREALREKFRELGMVMLQKSVWVWPYECRNEIRLIQEVFGLNEKEVNYIVADYIEEERRLRKHFNL